MSIATGTKLDFVATAYGPPWDSVEGSGVTSTGVNLQGGSQILVVAVDPNVVPYGTKLQFNPNPFNNPQLVFTASDTGGAIKGNRLDFFIASGRAAQNGWGVRNTTGTVVGFGSPTDVATLGRPGSTQPTAGGTAGAGGTGSKSSPTVQPFTVEQNEDFWTAANRQAQQAQVYLFSDAETIYLMDGASLLAQPPVATIDRWVDPGTGKIRTATDYRSGKLGADAIQRLDITYDNTAFEFSSTHKRKGKVQRKSHLSKVQSPTEAQAEIICPIDYFRNGDVVTLAGCGPANGAWIVGNCVRSVFQVYSTLTLVPGMAPLPEFEVAGVGSTSSAAAAGGATPGADGLVNPVGNWSPSRVDEGVDGTLGGNLLALGDSQMFVPSGSIGWGGGGVDYIAGKLTSGQHAGKAWYAAEGITPLVANGQMVKAGQPVAKPRPSGFNSIIGNIEYGWANPSNPLQTLAQSLPGYGGDQSPQGLAAGDSMNRLLAALGARQGARSGSGVGVTAVALPAGYP